MDENPLQEIIDRLFSKLDDPKISNKSYANLMYIAFAEVREQIKNKK